VGRHLSHDAGFVIFTGLARTAAVWSENLFRKRRVKAQADVIVKLFGAKFLQLCLAAVYCAFAGVSRSKDKR